MTKTTLFTPGPVEVPPHVWEAFTRPLFPHRGDAMHALISRAEDGLRRLLHTDQTVVLLTASGTALMEAALRSCVRNKLLVYSIGAFGDRWAELARDNGLTVDTISETWGHAARPERLRDVLRRGNYDTVAYTHNETSTGVLNPLPELAAVCNDFPEVISLVDGVSALGGVPINLSRSPADIYLASSQKALALPPGLAMGIVSDRARERARTLLNRGYYLDIDTLCQYADKRETHTTPSIPHISALAAVLKDILVDGGQAHYTGLRQKSKRVREWANDRTGLLVTDETIASPTVTAIRKPETLDITALNGYLTERGFLIASGYGQLKPTTFRIGHMGNISLHETRRLLSCIDQFTTNDRQDQ